MITKMCTGFGYFLLITKLPTYLSTIFGISILHSGTFSSVSILAHGICAVFAAPLSNWIIKLTAHRLQPITVRKVFQSIAMLTPALCLGLIPLVGCDSIDVRTLLFVAMLVSAFVTGGEWTLISEYAPNSAAFVFGFANILAFAMGVMAPYTMGTVLDMNHSHNRAAWNEVFLGTGGLLVLGAVVFAFFGTDRQQQWDKLANSDKCSAIDNCSQHRSTRGEG